MTLPLGTAIIVCGLAVLGEALFMGRRGKAYMESLRQPSIAPPFWAWSVIGFAYYAACFVALYRVTARVPADCLALGLLLVVMVANTFWNYLYFRRHDLRLVFWYSVVYAILVVFLLGILWLTDRVAALGFVVYVAYLPYALTLFYRTWKLNP